MNFPLRMNEQCLLSKVCISLLKKTVCVHLHGNQTEKEKQMHLIHENCGIQSAKINNQIVLNIFV